MKRNAVRTLFLLLALTASICLMSVAAFATTTVEVGTEKALRDAVAVENNVVKLTKNIELTSKLTVSRSLTIDLNGYNITQGDSGWDVNDTNYGLIQVQGASDRVTLTLTGSGSITASRTVGSSTVGSSTVGSSTAAGPLSAVCAFGPNATVNINGNVSAGSDNIALYAYRGGKINVISGAVVTFTGSGEHTHTVGAGSAIRSLSSEPTTNGDEVTYAINVTTTTTESSNTPATPVEVTTEVVTNAAVVNNVPVTTTGVISDATSAKATVEEAARRTDTTITAKTDSNPTDIRASQAAANAIIKAAAKVNDTNDINKIEVQLKTTLTSYALRESSGSVTAKSMTYEVAPVAVLKDDDGEELAEESLTNEDLETQNISMTFQLPIPDGMAAEGERIKVTHKSDGRPDETSFCTVEGGVNNLYVEITATHFSTFELETVVVPTGNALAEATLSLDGSIKINFYMTLTNDVKSIRFTFTDEKGTQTTNTVPVTADKYVGSDEQYVFSYPVAAKDIFEPVKVEMLNANNAPAQFSGEYTSFEYSVSQYLNAIIGNSTTYGVKMTDLAHALGVYGSYAHDQILGTGVKGCVEEYVGAEKAYNSSISIYDQNISALTNGLSKGGTYPSDDLKNPGMTLLLRSETVVANKFDYTGSNISGYHFYYQYADGSGNYGSEYEVTPTRTGNYYYVESKGIPAAELNRKVKYTVKDTSGNVVYWREYGPMVYGANKITGDSTKLLKNTIRALYNYNQKAIAYFAGQTS